MEIVFTADILLLIVKIPYCFTSVHLFRNKLPIFKKTAAILQESVVAILACTLVLNSFLIEVRIIWKPVH